MSLAPDVPELLWADRGQGSALREASRQPPGLRRQLGVRLARMPALVAEKRGLYAIDFLHSTPLGGFLSAHISRVQA